MARADAGSSSSAAAAAADGSFKRRQPRVTRACDFCHQRSIRCRTSITDPSSCQSCLEYGKRCAYERPLKRRGVAPGSSFAALATSSNNQSISDDSAALRLPVDLTHGALVELVVLFFETAFPVAPCFRRSELLARVAAEDYKHDRAFHGMLLALCALVCSYIRDGVARPAGKRSGASKHGIPKALKPDELWQLASAALPSEPSAFISFDSFRACALLALLALQRHDAARMQTVLGVYNMNAQLQNLAREALWPRALSAAQRTDRRALFWTMYALELFHAACFGSAAVSREAHAAVAYPLAPAPAPTASPPQSADHDDAPPEPLADCLPAWSFTVDLHRMLEAALDYDRANSPATSSSIRRLFYPPSYAPHFILEVLDARYAALPPQFRDDHYPTALDALTFSKLDMAITLALVRLLLQNQNHEPVEGSAPSPSRAEIGRTALRALSPTPRPLLKAMGAPFQHKLAVVASLILPASAPDPERALAMPVLRALVALVRSIDPAPPKQGCASWHLRGVWDVATSGEGVDGMLGVDGVERGDGEESRDAYPVSFAVATSSMAGDEGEGERNGAGHEARSVSDGPEFRFFPFSV